MEFSSIPEFEKDLKILLKRHRSLREDLEVVEKILRVKPDARPPFSYSIDGLGVENAVIKVKKIACKSLKGRGVQSGFRLVYAWIADENRVVYLQLYHKADCLMEDRNRIFQYFKQVG